MNRLVLPFVVAALLPVAAGGCESALFPNDLPRTQYERYDRLRGHSTPSERYDELGRRDPALRERLSPHRR